MKESINEIRKDRLMGVKKKQDKHKVGSTTFLFPFSFLFPGNKVLIFFFFSEEGKC